MLLQIHRKFIILIQSTTLSISLSPSWLYRPGQWTLWHTVTHLWHTVTHLWHTVHTCDTKYTSVTHSDISVTHSDTSVTHSDTYVTHSDTSVTHRDTYVTHRDTYVTHSIHLWHTVHICNTQSYICDTQYTSVTHSTHLWHTSMIYLWQIWCGDTSRSWIKTTCVHLLGNAYEKDTRVFYVNTGNNLDINSLKTDASNLELSSITVWSFWSDMDIASSHGHLHGTYHWILQHLWCALWFLYWKILSVVGKYQPTNSLSF